MPPITAEDLYTLLDTRHIPGTPDQLAKLATRIGELVEINGPQWVRQHRQLLLAQWQFILDQNIC